MTTTNPCQAHNLRQPPLPESTKLHGVKVSLRPGDPFGRLLGSDWNRTHWYASATERDAALAEMSREHDYSRPGDRPALVYEKVTRVGARR